jgi:Ca2+-binding EF-hand superfamily protein
MKKTSSITLFILSIFSTWGFAIDNNIAKQFKKLDRNQDGLLSRSEITIDPVLWSRFSRYDKNRDGMLTLIEYGLYTSK